ncbi:hypothetical protein P8452_36214 [Trifolium repens]|nr:hypothetical protein P8452_36214 [Trifolium repens]
MDRFSLMKSSLTLMGVGGDEEVNIDELASNLSIYKDQLHQVRQLLIDESSNSEYVDMERELCEILLTTNIDIHSKSCLPPTLILT